MAVALDLRPFGDDRDRDVRQFFDLDDIRIGMRTRWCADGLCRLFLLDVDETQFAGPLTLVPALDLLAPFKYDDRVPPGQLFIGGPSRVPPAFDTINVNVWLYYRPIAEVT